MVFPLKNESIFPQSLLGSPCLAPFWGELGSQCPGGWDTKQSPGDGTGVRAAPLQAARGRALTQGPLLCFQQREITEESGWDHSRALLTFKRTQLLISGTVLLPGGLEEAQGGCLGCCKV